MELLVIPYPVIDPIAIEIGPVAVRWYGLAYMAGILLGWLYARRLVSQPDLWGGKPPMTVAQADDFLFWITLGIVVGGRLGFVLFYEPSYFWQNPAEIPAVWHGGMSFHGGLLGVVLAVYLFARVKRINRAVARRHCLGGDAVRTVLRPDRQFHQFGSGRAGERRALGDGVPRRRRPAAPSEPALRGVSRRHRAVHHPAHRHAPLPRADAAGHGVRAVPRRSTASSAARSSSCASRMPATRWTSASSPPASSIPFP